MSAANQQPARTSWVVIVGAIAAMFALAVSFMTLVGGMVGVGIWKGGMDVRVSAIETASKEQIAALKDSTAKQITEIKEGSEKQIAAVVAASKEMVTAVQESTSKRLDAIERDRSEKLQDAARFRAEQTGINTRLETIINQQQKQLDAREEQGERRSKR